MTQFLDTPVDKSPTTIDAWVDVDLSSEIPEGATGAIFQIENTSIDYYGFNIRKKGSTDNRWPRAISPDASKFAIIGVDSNRKCQVKTAGLDVDLFLVGYTQNDAVFFTNGYDKSQTTTGVWADLDLSTELPEGAVAAIFEIENASTSAKSFGMRKKGSSDNRYGDLGVSYPNMFFIVGVDSNRKCQYKIETSAINFYLLGYLKVGGTETNGIDRSLGSTGSYVDITESGAPANSRGVFTEFDAISTNALFAARKNGSGWDKYCCPQTHKNMILAGLDGDKKWEGKISNTGMDFYTLGYFSRGITTDYDFWKKGSVIATAAGAQTDYQLELIVGESSGASGADVHCNGHCQNFPNDIRFIKEDGVTKHDYWIDTGSLEGTTPNQKVSVFIEVTSIPATGSVGFYMYYGKVSDSGESDGDNTFTSFDGAEIEYLNSNTSPPWDCRCIKDISNPIFSGVNTTGVCAIDVGKYNNYYYLVFSEWEVAEITQRNIYLARSTDLKNWTVLNNNNPILPRGGSGDWDEKRTTYMGILKDLDGNIITHDNKFWIFYTGEAASGGYWKLGRAYRDQSAGLEGAFTKDSANNPITLFSGNNRYFGPVLFKEGSTFYMYYAYGAGAAYNFDIHLATSSNLLSWTNSANNPLITNSGSGWKLNRVIPEGIFKRDSSYYLIYHGNDGTHYRGGIAKATAIDTNSWTDEAKNPILNIGADTAWDANYTDHSSLVAFEGRYYLLYLGSPHNTESRVGLSYLSDWKWKRMNLLQGDFFPSVAAKYAGNCGLEWKQTGSDGTTFVADPCFPNSGIFRVQIHWRPLNVSTSPYMYILLGSSDESHLNKTFIFYNRFGKLDIYNGVHHYLLDSLELKWYKLELVIDQTNHQILAVYVDGIEKLGGAINFWNSVDLTYWSVGGTYSAVGDHYLDNLLIRKYVSPEPTWGTWGAEVPTSQEIVKQSSAGLSISAESETISSAGLSIITRFSKESSAGLNISGSNIKQSSAGLGISGKNTKESSASLSISDRKTKESSAGLHIATLPEIESSASLAVKASYVKESSAGLVISTPSIKESSASLSISGGNTLISSAGLFICEPPLKKGLFYGKLGSTILETVMPESFRISEEINRIPSFEFEVANSEVNRTAIAANATALFEIYWQHHGVDTHIFTGIINADGIEYISLSNIRITGFASYAKLGWPLYKHLDSEDAEPVNTVFDFHGTYTDYTTQANNATINDVPITFGEENHCFYVGEANPFWGLQVKYSTKGVIPEGPIFGTNFDIVVANATSSKIETIPASHSASNIFITDLYLEVPALATPTKKIKLELLTERDNVIFSSGNLDASISKSFRFDIPRGLKNATKYKITTDANVTGNKTCNVEIRGWAVPENETIIEFSKGNDVWETLDVLDETNAFTEEPRTYDVIISHPPSDWARNTVNGISKFWIRWRVVSSDYTTSPKLDQIHTVNVDVYRVFYLATSARAILLDVLEDTEYSMDAIDACPEDEINLLAEYESPLRIIAAIPAALTWTDIDGSKKSYQWWIDEAKKVHIKKERGTTYSDDITGDLTIFNNLVDYFNVSNRLIGFSKRDGLSQIRAIVENKASQTTHALREIAVPKNEIGKYLTLKASLEKDIAYSKDPMQRIKGSVTTEFWGQNDYEVGDRVTLHQGEWVVEEGAFQIVKADIGPILTQLNLGISREHLEGLKSNLKRAFDISNVQMHGSTSLLTAGPETSNYERKSDGGVFSAKLKIEIPSEVVKTHKVLLSWTIGPYRASVNSTTGEIPLHNHGGTALIGGDIDSDSTGDDGGFTPDMLVDGGFTPSMLGKAHTHPGTDGGINYSYNTRDGYLATDPFLQYESAHVHSNPTTGIQSRGHTHSLPDYTGAPDVDYVAVANDYNEGSACTSGCCITGLSGINVPSTTHYHSLGGSTGGISQSHTHTQGNTGVATLGGHTHRLETGGTTVARPYMIGPFTIELSLWNTGVEDPAHIHDGVEEDDHKHGGVEEVDHTHVTPAVLGHSDHVISDDQIDAIPIDYGIHEEAPGTVLELLVNGEFVGNYSGDQTEIRIDGFLSSGTQNIEIQPIATELDKKGGATIWASGILFVEPKHF